MSSSKIFQEIRGSLPVGNSVARILFLLDLRISVSDTVVQGNSIKVMLRVALVQGQERRGREPS